MGVLTGCFTGNWYEKMRVGPPERSGSGIGETHGETLGYETCIDTSITRRHGLPKMKLFIIVQRGARLRLRGYSLEIRLRIFQGLSSLFNLTRTIPFQIRRIQNSE